MGRNESVWGHNIVLGGGGEERKRDYKKLSLGAESYVTVTCKGFSFVSQVLLASIVASIKTNPFSKILPQNHANTTYLQTALSHDTFCSCRIFKRKAVVYFSFISNPTPFPAPTTRPQYFCLSLHINER